MSPMAIFGGEDEFSWTWCQYKKCRYWSKLSFCSVKYLQKKKFYKSFSRKTFFFIRNLKKIKWENFFKGEDEFSRTWCQYKKCFLYTPLTSCQKSKKSDKIFRGDIFTQQNPRKWPKMAKNDQKRVKMSFSGHVTN